MRFEYNFCAGVLREICLVYGGKRWLAFGDSFCTWVDEEILLAGFVIWILEIIIKIKIRVLCEKIHKTSIIHSLGYNTPLANLKYSKSSFSLQDILD